MAENWLDPVFHYVVSLFVNMKDILLVDIREAATEHSLAKARVGSTVW